MGISSYISTDNYGSLTPVSDWLILCYGNLILHQKKRNGDEKKDFKSNEKKSQKSIWKHKVLFFILCSLH